MNSIDCVSCCSDEHKGLKYKGLSLVFMQTFAIPDGFIFSETKASEGKMISVIEKAIDSQIFVMPKEAKSICRYSLEGFTMDINLDDPYPVHLSGKVFVEMSLFFNKTITLTYRLVNDGKAFQSDNLLTTDHLIELASLNMGAEHWSKNEDDDDTNINLELKSASIPELQLRADGSCIHQIIKKIHPQVDDIQSIGPDDYENSFEAVCERYKKHVLDFCTEPIKRKIGFTNESIADKIRDLKFVMVDIWEDLQHHDGSFQEFGVDEAGIISHIVEHHKQELVGLMSLYPSEWPFRTKESFDDVCGINIAIDTDDLVLVNQNMCIVIGTYGLRSADAPTDWAEHLEERSHYHVSWPEYLLILEMILAKKFTISYASEQLLDVTLSDNSSIDPQELIAKNSQLSIMLTRLLLQLDVVKYSKFISHKIMFERTAKRLELHEDMARLREMMDSVDDSFENLSQYKSVKQSSTLNIVLGLISAVSLFEILFQPIELPFLDISGFSFSKDAAFGVIWFAAILMMAALLLSIILIFKEYIKNFFTIIFTFVKNLFK